MTIEQLKHEAIQLEPADREVLARWLIDSIDPLPQYNDFRAELDRRVAAHEANPESSLTLEEFRKRIKDKWGYESKNPS